ncbi:MAG: HAD family hydrolase [Alphaproteobacteria bacterium]
MKDIDLTNIQVAGFDLDDTLHFFKRASGAAAEKVFIYIGREFGVPVAQLRSDYQSILQNMQRTHFTENKPSREYRRGRFETLLETHSILPQQHAEEVLDVYDDALADSLTLKEGAYEALQAAKKAGKRVAVISEGPHDAQELTLERLGLAPFVDLLVTSAAHETSKSDGLFEIALEQLGCHPSQMLYTGDNPARDYVPAVALGIPAVLLHEGDDFQGNERRIKSLIELRDFF